MRSIHYALLTLLLCLVTLTSAAAAPRATAPSQIKTVYIVQHAHADVGFDAPPTVMFQRNHERTVAALDLADQYPEFRWTIETVYQLEGFLTLASTADVDRLRLRLAEGRFTYGANYSNLHSGLTGERQFSTLLEPGVLLAPSLGAPPNTAMLNDVPGFTVAMPSLLADGQIPYAVLGANDFIGAKPDIPLGERPFWWEGRDGGRVLTWLTYGSYIEGYFEWGLTSLNNARPKVLSILAEFEAAGYPYDAVMALRAADDEIPNATMAQLARDWNDTYTDIELKLATPAEFFDYLLATYGDTFPVYAGDASGMWESAAMVTPATTAMVRRARTQLADLESLWQQIDAGGGPAYPADRILAAWKLSLLFDEHSGGGFGWPGLLTEAEIRRENREFVRLAQQLSRRTATLAAEAVAIAAPVVVPAGELNLVLLNPGAAGHAGFVEVVSDSPLPADLRLIDADDGQSLTFRWLDAARTRLGFQTEIAGDGLRRWRVADGGATPPAPGWSPGDRMQVGDLELLLDPLLGTGAQLIDHAAGVDWLAQPGPHRFGGVETGTNLQAFFGIWRHSDPFGVSILVEDPTPVMRRMLVMDGQGRRLREYRLFDGEQRVDVIVYLHRSTLPFVPFEEHSHHYGVSFPLNLTPPTTLYVDGPDGWYQPGAESMPGAGLGHFASSTGARLVDANGRWLSITSLDSPMLDLGEMDEAPSAAVETDEVSLLWKLIRHADLSQVQGGDLVPMEAEPGMPDETAFHFVIRFGDADDPPPDRDTLHRDMAPPLATVVDRR